MMSEYTSPPLYLFFFFLFFFLFNTLFFFIDKRWLLRLVQQQRLQQVIHLAVLEHRPVQRLHLEPIQVDLEIHPIHPDLEQPLQVLWDLEPPRPVRLRPASH